MMPMVYQSPAQTIFLPKGHEIVCDENSPRHTVSEDCGEGNWVFIKGGQRVCLDVLWMEEILHQLVNYWSTIGQL